MQFLLALVLLFSTADLYQGLKLPNYVIPCSLRDPNLNLCAVKHGQEAIPYIIKGDNKYKIPSLSPLKLSEIKFNSGDLHIKLNNVEITGFEDIRIQDVNLDVENKHIVIKVAIDNANLLSDYDISGRILILPMQGRGPANITFIEGEYIYTFDYALKDKAGKEYLQIINNKLDYTTKRSYFHFDNLFEGDQNLGNQLNLFLDENWKDVQQDIGPALSQTINTIITTIITAIFDRVPFDSVFLP